MVYGMFNLQDKIKRYFLFGRTERNWLIASIFLLTFIIAYDDGSETFNMSFWVINFIFSLIIVALSVFIHEAAHRVYGLHSGFKTEFKPSFYTLIVGLILAFLTQGKVPILAYGGVTLHLLKAHRLGYFRYGLSINDAGIISALGPLVNIGMALMFRLLEAMPFLPSELMHQAVVINVALAISNMLPVPPLDGLNILFASRLLYVFSLAAISFFGLMLLLPQFIFTNAFFIAIFFGVAFTMVFFIWIEKWIF